MATRHRWASVGSLVAVVLGLLVPLATGLMGPAGASVDRNAAPSTSGEPTGCKTVSFTGAGGYYDQGIFNWQPDETVTVVTHWCYGDGLITSHHVTDTTTIPGSLDPRLSLSSRLSPRGAVLEVSIGGDYDSSVLNNVGFILIVGHVSSNGHHHFVNEPNAGG
jgi:hypothetical protein